MLTLLLDEHIAPIVAQQLIAKEPAARITSIHRRQEGAFLNTPDEIILQTAYQEKITLVAFDQSTIRPLLKECGEDGRSHGGMIFIDNGSIAQNDYGGLVKALPAVWQAFQCESYGQRLPPQAPSGFWLSRFGGCEAVSLR